MFSMVRICLMVVIGLCVIIGKICSSESVRERKKWTDGRWTIESCQRAIARSKAAYYLYIAAIILSIIWAITAMWS